MARVVVTGGAGKLGRACVDELIRHGWDVLLDRVRPPLESGVGFVPIDSTDYGQVLDAMFGVEDCTSRAGCIAHLAAVPAPGIVPDHLTFMNNISCTWNVARAARRAGGTNIVWASSEPCLGCRSTRRRPTSLWTRDTHLGPSPLIHWSRPLKKPWPGQGLLCRRWNPELKMIGLRFSNVMEPADYARSPPTTTRPHGNGTCGATSTRETARRLSVLPSSPI